MQKPENSTLINICAIPDTSTSQSIVAISQALESEQTMFVLGDGKFAHMTLYMARFDDTDVADVVAGVEEVLRPVTSFRCRHTGYFMTEGRYMEVSYRLSPELVMLQERLISRIAGVRTKPGHPFIEDYFAPYTPEQRKNAEETGYDLARSLFRPHVTLTRYADGAVPSAASVLPEIDLSFDLWRVCVYKADDNGAVYELIKKFTLLH